MVDELAYRRQVRQRVRVVHEMVKGDQGVGLAPAVSQLELPHRLVAPPGQAQDYLAAELAQVVGGIGQGEEFPRVTVYLARPAHHHLVEVGGEDGQREVTLS